MDWKYIVLLAFTIVCLACASQDDVAPLNEDNVVESDSTQVQDDTDQTDTTDMEQKRTFKFLALGDSYTIGESVDEKERWPVQLVDSMATREIEFTPPQIIAKTGWRTDELAGAIAEQQPLEDFDLVSLLIGVNNQYQGKSVESYKPEFEALLNTAIKHAGGDTSRVIIVSIPDYGFTPFGQSNQAKISAELDAYNQVNRDFAASYNVKYYYITDISRNGFDDPDLVAGDNLHPSGKQYALWVELIMQDEELLELFR